MKVIFNKDESGRRMAMVAMASTDLEIDSKLST